MLYWGVLLAIVLLTGSGAVGSDAFLVGILIGGLLCIVGLALVGSYSSNENDEEDRNNERY